MNRGNAMKNSKIALAVLLATVLWEAPVAADDPVATPAPPAATADRARIFLNGAFDFGSLAYSQTRTFKEFAENTKVDSQYSAGTGVGFELGLHWRFKGRLGAMASVTGSGRDAKASVTASIPHPLYLNQPRTATASQDNLSYHETTVHLDFVYAIPSGKKLELLLFAGPSYVDAKTDLITQLNYKQSYPYDEVTVTSLSQAKVGDSGFGFNIGGGLDYRLSPRFGLGAQVRFTAVSTTLAPPEGPTIDIDAGGFQAAFGVRVFF